jgi:hypothetical protein
LLECYNAYCLAIDPGLASPTIAISGRPPLALQERFVLPDLMALAANYDQSDTTRPTEAQQQEFRRSEENRVPSPREQVVRGYSSSQRARVPFSSWSQNIEREIVLGGPGAGKSTLLRFLALDLLSPKPLLRELRHKWPSYLPLWLSFPFWTRLIASKGVGGQSSLSECVSEWLSGMIWRP